MLGLSRKLTELGWEVTVMSIRTPRFDSADSDSLRLIPDNIRVIRTGAIDIAAPMYRKPQLVRAGSAVKTDSPAGDKGAISRLVGGVFRRARSIVAAPFVFPDRRVGWALPLVRATRAFLRSNPGTVVLSSSPPHSTQWALFLLRRIMEFSWVADFRDPWTYPVRVPASRLATRAHEALEKSVLRSADHLIINTQGSRDALLAHYPFLDERRVTTVTNAYDPVHEEEPTFAEAPDGDLAYFGEIYIRRLDRYLDGLRVLRDRGARLPVLDIYGRMPEAERRRVAELGFGDHIRFRGMLSYGQSLGAMPRVRSLLLLVSGGAGWRTSVPSKLYPYLYSERPVLVIGPEGDATRIVEETGAGSAITSDEPARIADGLASFLVSIDERDFAADRGAIRKFHIDHTGRQVSEILEAVRRC